MADEAKRRGEYRLSAKLQKTLMLLASGEAKTQLQACAMAGLTSRGLQKALKRPLSAAMRALRGATDVETAYAGGFVAGMLGHDSDLDGRQDWFLFVDGLLSDRGAKDVRVREGMEMWWAYRDWAAVRDPWATVGAWPKPFAGGPAPAVAVDAPLLAPLRAAGARIVADGPWRVRVGAQTDLLRREPAWRRASEDPERAGLTVRIAGGEVEAAGRDGWAPVPGARALAAAVPTDGPASEGTTLVVAGLDAPSAEAAAVRIARDGAVLAQREAAVFDGDGEPVTP
jgi:hypothetical protein